MTDPVPPIERLERWEQFGAVWRATQLTDRHTVIELCTCSGEPVDRLESDDIALITYVRSRGGASEQTPR